MSHPLDNPVININLLDSEIDVAGLLQGYKLCWEIISTQPLKPRIVEEISTGSNCQMDEEIRFYIREFGNSK